MYCITGMSKSQRSYGSSYMSVSHNKRKYSGFVKREGSRAEVWHGTAKQTSGGLTQRDLLMNRKTGRIVSRLKHVTALKEQRLRKYGFGPGVRGADGKIHPRRISNMRSSSVKKHKGVYVRQARKFGISKSRPMKGGYDTPPAQNAETPPPPIVRATNDPANRSPIVSPTQEQLDGELNDLMDSNPPTSPQNNVSGGGFWSFGRTGSRTKRKGKRSRTRRQ